MTALKAKYGDLPWRYIDTIRKAVNKLTVALSGRLYANLDQDRQLCVAIYERPWARQRWGLVEIVNAFIKKLSEHSSLSDTDVNLLAAACGTQRVFPARTDLIREGDKPGPVFVILQGWACRYKLLPEGSRQITSFLMPGDCCDLHASVLNYMEHSICTLTTARVALVPRGLMENLIDTRQAITRAFWWTQLVDEDTLRAWIVSMGRRDAMQRVAHLMCELWVRACNVGMTDGKSFELPLTQTVIGDALGLTPIHVNRVLRKLRMSGVMTLSGGSLFIADVAKLAAIAGFDDNYLHRRVRAA